MNNHVIIEDVTDDAVVLSIDGQLQQIRKEFSEFTKFFKDSQRTTFQNAEKIYNIGCINQANFEYAIGPLGRKQFNQHLTQKLILAIKDLRRGAAALLRSAEASGEPEWASSERFGDPARDLIVKAFVGSVAIQLRRLMAIGKEDLPTSMPKNYVQIAIQTARQAIELVCFVMLSALWDHQKVSYRQVPSPENTFLSNFFEDPIERSIRASLKLLQVLYWLFKTWDVPFPLPEIANLEESLREGSAFNRACERLNDLNRTLDAVAVEFSHCFEAEELLAELLSTLSFLAKYKMVSIKNIGYDEMRNQAPRYLYSYAEVRYTNEKESSERKTFKSDPINTDSIFLYENDYRKGINLFPFILDLSALTFESGAKISFYGSRTTEDNGLIYRYLETNGKLEVSALQAQNDVALSNDQFANIEYHKQMKLNMVVSLFEEAKNNILGQI